MSCSPAPMVADQTNPAQYAKVLGHHGVRDAQPPPQLADRDLRFVFRGEFPKELETHWGTERPKQNRRWMRRYLRSHAGIIASSRFGPSRRRHVTVMAAGSRCEVDGVRASVARHEP